MTSGGPISREPRRRRAFVIAAIALIAIVITRWIFRSHALFSWDSANFALGMIHIDIGAHRPHPYGYLGYVLVARGLNGFIHDPNMSLVVWNIVATAVSVIALLHIAWNGLQPDKSQLLRTAAAA